MLAPSRTNAHNEVEPPGDAGVPQVVGAFHERGGELVRVSEAARTFCQTCHQVEGWMGLPFSDRNNLPPGAVPNGAMWVRRSSGGMGTLRTGLRALRLDLLRAAGVTVTGVDIDELDPALTTGPRRGREILQATARIEFTAAGTAEPGQMPVRLGYALAMAAVTGVPVRVAGQLMDRLAVPAEGDLAGQFTRDVPLPRPPRGLSRLVHGRKLVRQPAR